MGSLSVLWPRFVAFITAIKIVVVIFAVLIGIVDREILAAGQNTDGDQ